MEVPIPYAGGQAHRPLVSCPLPGECWPLWLSQHPGLHVAGLPVSCWEGEGTSPQPSCCLLLVLVAKPPLTNQCVTNPGFEKWGSPVYQTSLHRVQGLHTTQVSASPGCWYSGLCPAKCGNGDQGKHHRSLCALASPGSMSPGTCRLLSGPRSCLLQLEIAKPLCPFYRPCLLMGRPSSPELEMRPCGSGTSLAKHALQR